MWYPRRMLKSVSRRKHLAGDDDPTSAVDFIERTGLVAALVDEGVGEVTRALGAGEMFAGSCKGTRVRKSPVESTDGGLSSEPSGFNWHRGFSGPCKLTWMRQWVVVTCAGVPASGENTRAHRACL
jgi:hypothetical protein